MPRAMDDPARYARRSTLVFVALWLAAFFVLYLLIEAGQRAQRRANAPVSSTAAGELIIPRARDGHFYVDGTVAGQPVRFLVDTGASIVSVGEALARRAGLPGGEPATFHTAAGPRRGRIVAGVSVSVGPLQVGGLRVGVGTVGQQDDDALLGQNFLSKFDIELRAEAMVLRLRPVR